METPLLPSVVSATRVITPLQSVVIPISIAAMATTPGLGKQGIYVTSDINVTVVGKSSPSHRFSASFLSITHSYCSCLYSLFSAVNQQNFSTDSFLVFPDTSLSISYIGACYKANIRYADSCVYM